MSNSIKAILFDSGRVLNYPITGHWFISPNFFKFVNEEKFKSLDSKARNNAFHKAGSYISEQNLIKDEDEELYHFIEFYRVFSAELPQLSLDDNLIKSIAMDLVTNYDKYRFYEDALDLIPELSESYRLAVVSDAWPSLENVFRQAGLRDCFSSFIISSIKGVTKSHVLMYKSALEELEVSPSETIFIDDNIRNCEGAEKLGIRSILLCRDIKPYLFYKITRPRHSVVRNLNNVMKIIKTAR